jgi:hypothetical protein
MEAKENISLIRLPFAHRADRSLSFVCLLTKKHICLIVLDQEANVKWVTILARSCVQAGGIYMCMTFVM